MLFLTGSFLGKEIWFLKATFCILHVQFAQEMSRLLKLHLRSTEVLAAWCYRDGILAFKMRPKHHYLWHIATEVEVSKINPSVYHVWEDEKYLGKIKRIVTKCHSGTCQRRSLERYILALSHFLFTR